jgi:hypothetical protein
MHFFQGSTGLPIPPDLESEIILTMLRLNSAAYFRYDSINADYLVVMETLIVLAPNLTTCYSRRTPTMIKHSPPFIWIFPQLSLAHTLIAILSRRHLCIHFTSLHTLWTQVGFQISYITPMEQVRDESILLFSSPSLCCHHYRREGTGQLKVLSIPLDSLSEISMVHYACCLKMFSMESSRVLEMSLRYFNMSKLMINVCTRTQLTP